MIVAELATRAPASDKLNTPPFATIELAPIDTPPKSPDDADISPATDTLPLVSTEKLPVFISKAPAPPSALNFIKFVLLSSALIRTLPLLSAKKPALVVAVVDAFATVPTLMLPPELRVTLPPVKVFAPSTQPPIDPLAACKLVAFKSPANSTADAVICPVAPFIFTVPPVESSSPLAITKPPISPDVALILPDVLTLPATILKLGLFISIVESPPFSSNLI